MRNIFLKFAQKLIEENEGKRLKVYDDVTGLPLKPGDTLRGHPTIGWGRALDVNGLSDNEVDALLKNDLQEVYEEIRSQNFSFWPALSEMRKAAIFDMAYNMGIGNLLCFRKMLSALKIKDFNEAALQLKDSDYWQENLKEGSCRAKQNYCMIKFDRYYSDQEAIEYFNAQ